jgi:hypothetical protein
MGKIQGIYSEKAKGNYIASAMKWDRPFFITLVYSLFTILYTVYITAHLDRMGKGHAWLYFLEFLVAGGYAFFILQGLNYRSKNWGVLLLLPIVLLAATILIGFALVGLLRIGGGTLLDRDKADMILAVILFLTLGIYAQKWIRPRKSSRKK